MFNITLSGSLSGSGTFTTNGTCDFCEAPGPLSSLNINIGRDSETDAFDVSDDLLGPPFPLGPTFYMRLRNVLVYYAFNSETSDNLAMNGLDWNLSSAGSVIGSGTYSVTPAPEPRSMFLLMPIVALVGLRWRHQRHRA
jgi:hypothetical protein